MQKKFIEVRKDKDGKEFRVNGITVTGNLTQDVPPAKEVEINGEKRLVTNGLKSSLACDYRVPNEKGDGYEKKTNFYPFTLWGPRGKFFQTLKKGDKVTVVGYLKNQEDSYEKDGKTFTTQKEVLIIEDFDVEKRASATKKNEVVTEEKMEIDGIDIPF